MLKSWSIENFKPIVNSGELKLAPVTILAGRNSSGKSSLLQSILMIAQTLSNQVPDRALLPNERIVQLGTFEDILSEFSDSHALTIHFTLDIEGEKRVPIVGQGPISTSVIVTSVKVLTEFKGVGDNSNSSAIEASNLTVERILMEFECQFESAFEGLEAGLRKLTLIVSKSTNNEFNSLLQDISGSDQRIIPYFSKDFTYFGDFITEGAETEGSYLVELSHFLPLRLFRRYDREERLRSIVNRGVTVLFTGVYSHPDFHEVAEGLSDALRMNDIFTNDFKRSIHDLCEANNISKPFSGQSLPQLVDWFWSLKEPEEIKKDVGKKLKELIIQKIIDIPLKIQLPKGTVGLEVVANNSDVAILEQAVTEINRFFTSKIRYLGPLRADPQASQKFAPSSELDDVGQKGEYSAAVYDANQEARIEWFNPFSKQIERSTLKVALDNWARYLDVANQIGIETAGQSGFSWQVVHKEGQKALPLSAVGVGVSQVLPILVMGLLAPANTLLIIEQPELHLHASVQARLGDFFVGLSKCKKQCLIETHSENLVSQLRYHIVQSGGQDKSDCMIYFVDQDEKGAAKFERIEISARGNILNWPSGFFDESMHQEDKITAASIRRRAKLATND